MNSYATSVSQLGRWSVVAGVISMVLAGLISLPWTETGAIWLPVAVLGLALAILFAVVSGGARLILPGELGRTWWGVLLAFFAGSLVVLSRFSEWFPALFLVGSVGLHLLANLAASARVARESELEPSRRRWQIGLVWVVPVVGVMLISAFYRAQDDPWQDDGYETSGGGFFD